MLKIVSATVFLFILGMVLASFRTHAVKNDMVEKSVSGIRIVGKVVKSEGSKITAEIAENRRIRITLENERPDIGDILVCTGNVFPLMRQAVPGGFDFRRKGYFDGLSGYGRCKQETIRILRLNKAPFFEKIRRRISEKLERHLSGEKYVGIAESFVIGRQENIDGGIKDDFRISGIAHILSVSGFHMSLVSVLFFFFARLVLSAIPPLALRFNIKKITAVVAFVMTLFYLQISGKDLPAVRSFIMVSVGYLAILLDRRVFSLQSVALAALLIIVPFPESVFQIGFQLSFMSVLALIAGYEAGAFGFVKRAKGIFQKIGVVFGAVLMTDFIATLSTLPFLIYHFQIVTPYSLLTNFLTNPLFSFLSMPFLIVGLLASSAPAFKIAEMGMEGMVLTAGFISGLKGADIPVKALPDAGMASAALGLLWVCLWTGKRRLIGLPLFILGSFSGVFLKMPEVIMDQKTVISRQDGRYVLERGEKTAFKTRIWFQRFGQRAEKAEKRSGKNTVKCLKYVCYVKLGESELKITKRDLREKGTHMVFKENSLRIKTVRDVEGKRPWTLHEKERVLEFDSVWVNLF